ncbi:MAG: hypothetical protein M0P33_00225 [Massilibacteroides sp.]|nr:hypothetical protein [Massilibacteroides sp.]
MSMLRDNGIELNMNQQRCWERIRKQVNELLSEMPIYNKKILRRLERTVSMVWDIQKKKKCDAVTMLYTALWLAEEVRIAQNDAARKNNRPVSDTYHVWSRLAGSLFTFSKHLGDHWINSNDPHQLEAVSLGEDVVRYA